MTDNIHRLPDHRPDKAARQSPRVSPQQAVALLTSCLALVRPVGMTPDEVEDWLSVALGEVMDIPGDALEIGCSAARRSCTHHAQIVPAIIREAAPIIERNRRIAALPTLTWNEPERLPPPALTQETVDAMPEKLIKIGLSCGALIRDADGNVGPAQ